MSDEELEALTKTYGNEQNDIKYLEFINDATPNKTSTSGFDETGTIGKSTYFGQT
jgi:hypothetical protein